MANKKEESEPVKLSEMSFSKEQIILSEKYKFRRDALTAILEDKKYTLEQVDSLLEKFMKGKV